MHYGVIVDPVSATTLYMGDLNFSKCLLVLVENLNLFIEYGC